MGRNRTPSRSRSRTADKERCCRRRCHRCSSSSSRSRSPPKRRSRSARRSVDRLRYRPPPTHCLGVFGLSIYTNESRLKDVFGYYGTIRTVTLIMDAKTRRSRGFAFIYFEEIDAAERARDESNGMDLDGRRIRVDFSFTKRPHSPTPGVYMGDYRRRRRGRSRSRSRSYTPRVYRRRRRSRSVSSPGYRGRNRR